MTKDSCKSPATEAPAWSVGVARRCITPQTPIWLYGYACPPRYQPSTGVLSDLFADALVFEAGDTVALLLCLDLCLMRKPLAEAMRHAVSRATGIPDTHILLNLSHTHSGPCLDQPDLDGRFPLSTAERARIAEYTHWLQAQAVEAATAAMRARQPARLNWGLGNTSVPCNRRRHALDGQWSGMGPNPDGPVDRCLPVLRVDAPDGQPRVILFGCACHNVTLDMRNLKVSADYAGYARAALEAEHPGCQAMFLSGCGADANTEPRGGPQQEQLAQQHGDTLAAEVSRVLGGTLATVAPPLACRMETIPLPLASTITRETLEAMASGPEWLGFNAWRLLDAHDRNVPIPDHYSAPISVWQFGADLTIIGLSGEVVSHYAARLHDALGSARLWVAGYCHEVFGYLPSQRIMDEGGYETRGLLPPGMGYFTPQVEDIVVEAAVQLARQAGRPEHVASR